MFVETEVKTFGVLNGQFFVIYTRNKDGKETYCFFLTNRVPEDMSMITVVNFLNAIRPEDGLFADCDSELACYRELLAYTS